MVNPLLNPLLNVISSVLYFFLSFGMAFSIGSSGYRYIINHIVWISLIVVVALLYGFFTIYSSLKGFVRKQPKRGLFIFTIIITIISVLLIVIPMFDQLGWFGF